MNLVIACLIIAFVLFSGHIASGMGYFWGKLKALQVPALPSVDIHYKLEWWKALLVGLAVYLVVGGVSLQGCNVSWPAPDIWPAHSKPDAVTYVYEKDDGEVPPAVKVALSTLNSRGITANPFDDDTRDGDGEVPDQYKVPLEAANKAGLPSLVATAGKKVVRVVKSPTTVEEVLEAAK